MTQDPREDPGRCTSAGGTKTELVLRKKDE